MPKDRIKIAVFGLGYVGLPLANDGLLVDVKGIFRNLKDTFNYWSL
ncbi:MAG: hypothetical protein J7L96_07245 [Bacteroidales bacterium]|nr:hypothetical protein [Bacteroidales bacterium]